MYNFEKNVLEQCNLKSDFLWNALFVILYESKYKELTIQNQLANPSNKYYLGASRSTLHNYLSFKTRLNEQDFNHFCDVLNLTEEDVNSISINQVLNCFCNVDAIGHKKERSRIVNEGSDFWNDDYIIEQEIREGENIDQCILKKFNDLSTEQTAILYPSADVFLHLSRIEYCTLRLYVELNSSGRSLFMEGLQTEWEKDINTFEDEHTSFFRQLATDGITPASFPITPEMLLKRLSEVHSDTPEHADLLISLADMKVSDWETLLLYHKIIMTIGEDVPKDFEYNYAGFLYIFANCLWNLPSLRK